jgi:hypothetical protein
MREASLRKLEVIQGERQKELEPTRALDTYLASAREAQ